MGAYLVGPGGRVEVDNDQGDPLAVEVIGGLTLGTVEVTNDQGNPLPVSGTVALDTATLAALESVTATIANLPADFPDAALLAKLEAVRALLAATLTVSGTVSVANFPATQAVSGVVAVSSLPEVEVKNDSGGPLAVSGTVTVGNFPAGGATEATLAALSSPFARLLKFEPAVGEEIRRDETATDDYHGAAPDGTATSAASWRVARFRKNASGLIVRVQYRTGIAWDDRTDPGVWT